VAGGVTSFMEMPNTNPTATTHEELEKKYAIGAATSVASTTSFFGATNTNLEAVKSIDPKKVCGVKVFMGSSTGTCSSTKPPRWKASSATPRRSS
jgi:dihydroorotase